MLVRVDTRSPAGRPRRSATSTAPPTPTLPSRTEPDTPMARVHATCPDAAAARIVTARPGSIQGWQQISPALPQFMRATYPTIPASRNRHGRNRHAPNQQSRRRSRSRNGRQCRGRRTRNRRRGRRPDHGRSRRNPGRGRRPRRNPAPEPVPPEPPPEPRPRPRPLPKPEPEPEPEPGPPPPPEPLPGGAAEGTPGPLPELSRHRPRVRPHPGACSLAAAGSIASPVSCQAAARDPGLAPERAG